MRRFDVSIDNALNRVNYNVRSEEMNILSPFFGQIRSINGSQRTIQLGARLTF
jgi:hypothetical protein